VSQHGYNIWLYVLNVLSEKYMGFHMYFIFVCNCCFNYLSLR